MRERKRLDAMKSAGKTTAQVAAHYQNNLKKANMQILRLTNQVERWKEKAAEVRKPPPITESDIYKHVMVASHLRIALQTAGITPGTFSALLFIKENPDKTMRAYLKWVQELCGKGNGILYYKPLMNAGYVRLKEGFKHGLNGQYEITVQGTMVLDSVFRYINHRVRK